LVGKTGVEKYYETYLRGQKGFRQVEVTSHNQPVKEVRAIPSVPGDKLVLTMDLKLQQAMETAFDEVLARVQKKYPKAKAGAAVLLDVKTGKTLAMVSRPGLNPEEFNGKSLSQAQADYYFSKEPPALRNRVIQGNYVPGSTFKPVTGMALLESGQASPLDTVVCTGRYWISPYIKCTGVHGRLNYYSAMARSCNVYFQEMGRRAGIAQIGKVGLGVGLGDRTGIDLPFESKGLLPHLEWQKNEFALRREKINQEINQSLEQLEKEYSSKIKEAADGQEKKQLEKELKSKKRVWEQRRRERLELYTEWHDWDTFNTSIGQGYNQYTVIQLANYAATIASGGKRYKPSVVERIVDNAGIVVEEFETEPLLISTISPTTFAETKKAMTAVTAPGGTAYSLFSNFPANIKVAAKTGTAQPGRAGYIKNKDFDGVFIAFAPADDPQIAFAGVIEHGYSGSGSVGLVAKAIFEEYFGINKQKQVKTSSAPPALDGQSTPENRDTQTSTETPVQTGNMPEETSAENPEEIPVEIPEKIIPEQIGDNYQETP
jgi:penicillin-binding protein 2